MESGLQGRGSENGPQETLGGGLSNGAVDASRAQRRRRLRAGELIALAGAICAVVSMFLPAYESSLGRLTGWDTFGPASVLIAAAAAASLALAVSTLGERSTALPVSLGVWSTLLSIGAVVASVVRVFERPQGASSALIGTWLVLAGSIAMLVGSWQSMRDERTATYRPPQLKRRKPPAP
jgi:hypothetical protein